MAKKKKTRYPLFDPVIRDMQEWPLTRLSRNRKEFLNRVIEVTMKRILEMADDGDKVEEEIADALYHEKNRIRLKPWPVDPKDEKDYWRGVEEKLVDLGGRQLSKEEERAFLYQLLESIVVRYGNEIIGNFQPGAYKFARALIPHGFASLLRGKTITQPPAILKRGLKVEEKIHLGGELELIRELATKGTIVMVPTHFSNLDSILMGWGIQAMGLPAFHYGAGLNLFNVRLLSFFMNRLGAYKVDRRKKNRIYLETLKQYSTLSIKEGIHALFFPGGTRSRSGELESRLKLGLLSTAIEAQRLQLSDPDSDGKVFIVPVVINYHFVLEAPSLIDDYLKAAGKERYYDEKDELSSTYKLFKFLLKFLTVSSDIALSFGQPTDVFGHLVNSEGESMDKQGKPIDISGYFIKNGQITDDDQRDGEYARMLSEHIIQEYRRINLVFSSHLVAFTAFELFKQQHKKLDLYEFLRIPEEDLTISYSHFTTTIEQLREKLQEMKVEGKLDLPPHMQLPVDDLVQHGLNNLGLYHARKTLKKNKKGDLVTEDMKTLFYYHNRLNGYGLEKWI